MLIKSVMVNIPETTRTQPSSSSSVCNRWGVTQNVRLLLWRSSSLTHKALLLALPQRSRSHAVRHQSKEGLLHLKRPVNNQRSEPGLQSKPLWVIRTRQNRVKVRSVSPAAWCRTPPVWNWWGWCRSTCGTSWSACRCLSLTPRTLEQNDRSGTSWIGSVLSGSYQPGPLQWGQMGDRIRNHLLSLNVPT